MNSYYHRRNAEVSHWSPEIEQAHLKAFTWQCPICRADLRRVGYVRAHIDAVGSNVGFRPGNVIPLCNICNGRLGQQRLWDWCIRHKVAFDWMIPILATLARIYDESFQDPTIIPSAKMTLPEKRPMVVRAASRARR